MNLFQGFADDSLKPVVFDGDVYESVVRPAASYGFFGTEERTLTGFCVGSVVQGSGIDLARSAGHRGEEDVGEGDGEGEGGREREGDWGGGEGEALKARKVRRGGREGDL